MKRLKISPDGPEFSHIALGMMRLNEWKMSVAELVSFIENAVELGFTTFDHADIYGSYTVEEAFGKALAKVHTLRDKIEIVTKCNIRLVSKNRPDHTLHAYDSSKDHIIRSAETSLKNLHTDFIDVLLIHRPDPLMDADEIAEAFEILKDSGKVDQFGVSNFSPYQFDLLQSRVSFPLVTNQVEFSLLQPKALYDGTLDQCQQKRISPMAWSPFGGGSLFNGNADRDIRMRHELTKIGEELGGAAPDQVALAWILKHPSKIVPVLGTGNLDRIKGAKDALDLELSRDQWFRLLEASNGFEVP